jgi:GH25 family lysozyme M1 (1,4-beta-N-acetylmuramidase)
METKKTKISPLTIALIATVLILALALTVMTVVGMPSIEEQGLIADPPTEPPTLPPTEPPTEPPPTLPPPEENPFGDLDFQYEGRYLKLRGGRSLTGIDVSHWQNDIDWEQVRDSGVDFAMIRLGYRGYEQGGLSLDSYAIANLDGAIAAGLQVGVYFFSQALTPEEAEEEAYFVVEELEDYKEFITMPVVFDWEHVSSANARTANMRDPDILTDCTLAFLQTIEAAGYTPMVYFNRTQSWKYLNLEELTDYDFWLAAYTQRMDFPYKIKMWQYTCKGSVPGVTGDCDINIYFPDV